MSLVSLTHSLIIYRYNHMHRIMMLKALMIQNFKGTILKH